MKGKIALCRYGAIFRGDKVQLAVKYGAIGMILYSDPFDYTNGRNDVKVILKREKKIKRKLKLNHCESYKFYHTFNANFEHFDRKMKRKN